MKLAVCAIARNEASYIVEWIAYYKALGFDEIFVYDNVSDDGTSEWLAALDKVGEINREHWPRLANIPPQRSAYEHFIAHHGRRFDWALICDLDEFLVCDTSVRDFILQGMKARPDVKAFGVPWLIFGADGQEEQRPGLVIERFTNCKAEVDKTIKSLFSPRHAMRMRTHICDLIQGEYLTSAYEQPLWSDVIPIEIENATFGHATMHHYYTKSREEWVRRRTNPKADRGEISFSNVKRFDQYKSLPERREVAPEILSIVKYIHEELTNLVTHHRFADLKPELIYYSSTDIVLIVPGADSTTPVRVTFEDGIEDVYYPNKDSAQGLVYWVGHRFAPNGRLFKASVVGSLHVMDSAVANILDPMIKLDNLLAYLPTYEEAIYVATLRACGSEDDFRAVRAKIQPERFIQFKEYADVWRGILAAADGASPLVPTDVQRSMLDKHLTNFLKPYCQL
ncbi:MAG: glycosyltransferase family 2 protein [Sphingobium sp.]